MTRTRTRRRAAAPALAITPRHVWLATLGLAARSRRQALQLGVQAEDGITHWRAAIGTRAVGLEQAVRETGERLQGELQTRMQPLLTRVGLGQRSKAVTRKPRVQPSARKPVRKLAKRRSTARKGASRRA